LCDFGAQNSHFNVFNWVSSFVPDSIRNRSIVLALLEDNTETNDQGCESLWRQCRALLRLFVRCPCRTTVSLVCRAAELPKPRPRISRTAWKRPRLVWSSSKLLQLVIHVGRGLRSALVADPRAWWMMKQGKAMRIRERLIFDILMFGCWL
jgi:hypothetical protein